MDRSVDSIGSCSLDVDADSTDFSDTSGSLNLATPSSAKDITREFTSRIKERCQISQINCQQTTTILDPSSGKITTIITSTADTPNSSPAKKPSYLNLACCVNGYSNLTTYDSKLRQNINKSREVSPIRPSTNSFQYCKAFGNLLTPPVPMPAFKNKLSCEETMTDSKTYIKERKTIIKQSHERNVDVTDNVNETHFRSTRYFSSALISPSTDSKQNENKTKSFIQQRVERLYGPGALAQGFYSPKKTRSCESTVLCERLKNAQNQYSNTNFITSQKEYYEHRSVKSNNDEEFENMKNCDDLPVLRHLRPEFRAQLPILSPKKSQQVTKKCTNNLYTNDSSAVLTNGTTNTQYLNGNSNNDKSLLAECHQKDVHINSDSKAKIDGTVDDRLSMSLSKNSAQNQNVAVTVSDAAKLIDSMKISEKNSKITTDNKITVDSCENSKPEVVMASADACENNEVIKVNCNSIRDGHYFLQLLKTEQSRLLDLAVKAELEIEKLSNSDVSEDIFGYLRSAAGKARLLVSQKMKQFEGLCNNNLNQLPDEKFPTTVQDLQGFWDMVMLQVDHVDSLFKEIEVLKLNDWKKPIQEEPRPPSGSKLVKRPNLRVTANSTSNNNATNSIKTNNGGQKKSTTASLAAQKREAQRKELLEMKRKNKIQQQLQQQQQQQSQNSNNSVEIFVSEHCS